MKYLILFLLPLLAHAGPTDTFYNSCVETLVRMVARPDKAEEILKIAKRVCTEATSLAITSKKTDWESIADYKLEGCAYAVHGMSLEATDSRREKLYAQFCEE